MCTTRRGERDPGRRAAGIVLAAGAGTRYGMPKVLAERGDWLRRAVASLADAGCVEVVVVLGAAVVAVPPPARAVIAADWARGMSESLRTGLSALADGTADLAVVRLVDTPDIGADVVRRVLDAAEVTGLARATYRGRPGHPVIVARQYWSALAATCQGEEGARGFLAVRDDLIEVECADLATGADIDIA